MLKPPVIKDKKYRYDSFADGKRLPQKRAGRLPVMGWNSWNAFGSENTEALTMAQAQKFIELGLKDVGYSYIVLDDGCYRQERVDGKLACETIKFPSGFKGLADKLHAMGLKFGMYNDIGTNLCGGAAVGTCGFEEVDAASYKEWDIDFIKVDNCYYPWDNATFAAAENARFSWAPAIRAVRLSGAGFDKELSATEDGRLVGDGAEVSPEGFVTRIGTKDGPGPDCSPLGPESSELVFDVNVPSDGEYLFKVLYSTAKQEGRGEWLQVGVGSEIFYDDLLPETPQNNNGESSAEGTVNDNKEQPDANITFIWSDEIKITLKAGENTIRIMNHRRQENPHHSYARFLECMRAAAPDRDIVLSVCEWGKNQPQNWAYRVGDSWRILNDITFSVGSDGKPGNCGWVTDYTTSIPAQYNKACVMDEFAGLDKGWNDPDMMVLGMNGVDDTMNRTHFAMWCMLNAPLVLGLDLRTVKKGDLLHHIMTNTDLIALNQDPLGIQAKRVMVVPGKGSSVTADRPDQTYITDNNRVDVLAKPLADGSIAVSFFNLSDDTSGEIVLSLTVVEKLLGNKIAGREKFFSAASYEAKDLWTKETVKISGGNISVKEIPPHGDVTFKVTPSN